MFLLPLKGAPLLQLFTRANKQNIRNIKANDITLQHCKAEQSKEKQENSSIKMESESE